MHQYEQSYKEHYPYWCQSLFFILHISISIISDARQSSWNKTRHNLAHYQTWQDMHIMGGQTNIDDREEWHKRNKWNHFKLKSSLGMLALYCISCCICALTEVLTAQLEQESRFILAVHIPQMLHVPARVLFWKSRRKRGDVTVCGWRCGVSSHSAAAGRCHHAGGICAM